MAQKLWLCNILPAVHITPTNTIISLDCCFILFVRLLMSLTHSMSRGRQSMLSSRRLKRRRHSDRELCAGGRGCQGQLPITMPPSIAAHALVLLPSFPPRGLAFRVRFLTRRESCGEVFVLPDESLQYPADPHIAPSNEPCAQPTQAEANRSLAHLVYSDLSSSWREVPAIR